MKTDKVTDWHAYNALIDPDAHHSRDRHKRLAINKQPLSFWADQTVLDLSQSEWVPLEGKDVPPGPETDVLHGAPNKRVCLGLFTVGRIIMTRFVPLSYEGKMCGVDQNF